MIRDGARKAWDRAKQVVETGRDWAQTHLPPGVRLLVGLMLMAGGVLGFLPVLGFWMLPLGVAIAALDVKPMYRWLAGLRPWKPAAWRRKTPQD